MRAWSKITVKSYDDDKRIIEGVASTPSVDRDGDIVEPMGADLKLPIPLLWQHDGLAPIGNVVSARPTKNGIRIRAKFDMPEDDDPPALRYRLEEAWRSVKRGLVRGLSIGFRAIERATIDQNGGVHFLRWDWHELSVVTIPANRDATITAIKAADLVKSPRPYLRIDLNQSAGAAAKKKTFTKGKNIMSISKRIAALKQKRADVEDRMTELNDEAAKNEDGVKNAVQRQEMDELKQSKALYDAEIADLESATGTNANDYKKLDVADQDSAAKSRDANKKSPAFSTEVNPPEKPEGVGFAQFMACMIHAKGIPLVASQYADRYYENDKRISALCHKAAVPAAITHASDWAGAAAEPQTLVDEFIAHLRPRTIIGRIDEAVAEGRGFKRRQFNKKVVRMTDGGAAGWVGQAKPIAMSAGAMDTVTIPIMKIAGLTAMSEEQVEFDNVDSMMAIRDDLAAACIGAQDATFVDETAAEVSNVSPASMTNGLAAIASASGTDADSVRQDFTKLRAPFTAANLSTSGLVLITNEDLAGALSDMYNALGVAEFPDMTPEGGRVRSFRAVIASQHVKPGHVIALSPENVLLAQAAQVDIRISTEASVEMLDGALTQDGQAGTGSALVSAFQSGMVLIRATLPVAWVKARAAAAAYIDDADWNGVATA